MIFTNKEQMYKTIEALECERMNYLEVNNKAGARRKEKKIEEIELQIELLSLNNIKKELKAYKKVCNDYPEIIARVKQVIEESEDKQ